MDYPNFLKQLEENSLTFDEIFNNSYYLEALQNKE